MLKALFFYLKNTSNTEKTSPNFLQQISSLIEALSLQQIACYFIEDTNAYTFPQKSINSSYFFTQLTNTPIQFLINNYTYEKTEVLLISNDPDFLQQLKPYSLYTIGYMDSTVFLPTTYCFESFEQLDYLYFSQIYHRYQKEPITILSTNRTIVRELSPNDLPALYELFKDKENVSYLSEPDLAYKDFFEKWNAYIKQVYPFYDFGLWGVFSKETNTLIGQFGIQNVTPEQEVEVGYLLGKKYQKKGLGKEVLRAIFHYIKTELDFSRLIAIIHPNNLPSIALASACGMHLEKTIIQNHSNMLLYAIDIS